MKIGIMQPYFFPYLGYFSLIKNTDKWIVFDTVQYIDKGWMNRNRIIHPTKLESTYITVPLKKHSREILIKDVEISMESSFKEKILNQLEMVYKKRAKYYNEVYKLVEESLNYNTNKLSDMNTFSLKNTCEYLGIEFNYEIYSKMDLKIDEVNHPGEWALNICKELKASEYLNPPGGIELFDNEKFENEGINLNFLQINLEPYEQKKKEFIPGLSIIDVMMFNSRENILEMLDNYKIIKNNNEII